jgi:hypothetical protein
MEITLEGLLVYPKESVSTKWIKHLADFEATILFWHKHVVIWASPRWKSAIVRGCHRVMWVCPNMLLVDATKSGKVIDSRVIDNCS